MWQGIAFVLVVKIGRGLFFKQNRAADLYTFVAYKNPRRACNEASVAISFFAAETAADEFFVISC